MVRDALPVGLRALSAVAAVATRLGLLPAPVDAVTKPVEERQGFKPMWLMAQPRPAGVVSDEQVVVGRAGPLRVRVHRPADAVPGPAIFYVHGGGFVIGGLDACDWLCAELAVRSSVVVVAVEYRIAPEDKFPAALDDCVDALRWLADGGLPGVDPHRIAVAGESAGGNLTAALALLARDGAAPAFRHQTLIYPFLDSTLSGESWETCAGMGLDRSSGEFMLHCYVGDEGWDNPLVSPLSAADLGGLAPALVITAQHDVLRDDGRAYAQRLEEAGVPVRYTEYVRMPHGFLSMPRLCAAAPQALAEIAREIRVALGVGQSARAEV